MRSLSEAFKLIMQARSWTQAKLGEELGKDQAFVSTVISGKRDPRISTVMHLLDSVGWEVRFAPKREESDPMRRREFVTAAASVAFVPSPPGAAPFRDPTYLRELAGRIHHDRREHGGIASMPTAMRYVQRIRQAVGGRDRQLQAAASNVAASVVWTLEDAGRFDLGDSVGRFALELAQCSGDSDAHSRALSALTKISVHRGDAGDAVRYALQAVRLREVPDGQRDFLTLRLGEALSIAPGQEHATRDVVDGLRATLADAQSRGEASHDVAAQMGVTGHVLYELGAYEEAQACLDESMRIGPSPLTTGYNLARQAKVALRASEPDLAADRMLTLARVVPLVHSAKLNRYLTEVLSLSVQWRAVSEVHEARRQLQSVMPTPPHAKQ